MEYLASMYIDDELDLEEKVRFIDKIHEETQFYRNTKNFLDQERLLRIVPDTSRLPSMPPRVERSHRWLKKAWRPISYTTAGFTTAFFLLFFVSFFTPSPYAQKRFLIYEPHARQVMLTGTFTGWQSTPMRSIGDSGYWELSLPLSSGEHRFAYILDGSKQMADPTMPKREKDDFGGENSIIYVGEQV